VDDDDIKKKKEKKKKRKADYMMRCSTAGAAHDDRIMIVPFKFSARGFQ
jgi:hypothetical protein